MKFYEPDGEGRPSFGVRFMVAPAKAAAPPKPSSGGLTFKPGVRVNELRPEITRTYPLVEDAWRNNGGPAPVVTSGSDGKHRRDSKHYSDAAIDLRCNNLSDEHCQRIADSLQKSLGSDYDVVFERYPSDPSRDHIHLEYDAAPRRGGASVSRVAPPDDIGIGEWMHRRSQFGGGS